MTLCCLILGGVGNRAGVILGVVLVFGFDNLLSPVADSYLQRTLQEAAEPSGDLRIFGVRIGNTGSPYLNFSGWRLPCSASPSLWSCGSALGPDSGSPHDAEGRVVHVAPIR